MKKVLILTTALFVTIFVVVILGNVITIGEKFTTVFGVPDRSGDGSLICCYSLNYPA